LKDYRDVNMREISSVNTLWHVRVNIPQKFIAPVFAIKTLLGRRSDPPKIADRLSMIFSKLTAVIPVRLRRT
jgi:hypothetical protein